MALLLHPKVWDPARQGAVLLTAPPSADCLADSSASLTWWPCLISCLLPQHPLASSSATNYRFFLSRSLIKTPQESPGPCSGTDLSCLHSIPVSTSFLTESSIDHDSSPGHSNWHLSFLASDTSEPFKGFDSDLLCQFSPFHIASERNPDPVDPLVVKGTG